MAPTNPDDPGEAEPKRDTVSSHHVRGSVPAPVAEYRPLSKAQAAEREAANGLRQFDRLIQMIDERIAASSRPFRLRPSMIMELNRIAVDGLEPHPGHYRDGPITIDGSLHQPPGHEDAPLLVEQMCDYVDERWPASTALHLSAYVLWRLNWIHPFREGNGRTSRAIGYYVLCSKLGYRLPGRRTIPDFISENKRPYYHALDAADARWKEGAVDVSEMEQLLKSLLARQLVQLVHLADGDHPEPDPSHPGPGTGWGSLD